MLRRTSRAVIALLGFAAASFGTSRAALAATKVIAGPATLGGTNVYDELVVESGTLTVPPYTASGMNVGMLIIKANRITVNAGATISATGAGYPGVELTMPDGTGMAEMGSNGGGKASMALGHPGGGGGYNGKGAVGLDAACAPFAGDVTGGVGFYPMLMKLAMGSAGGAANVASMVSRGGAGGGMIVLEAAEILINGTIEVNGGTPTPQQGVAPGGGSGGTIQILTWNLLGSGTLSVAGGDGAHGNGDMPKGIQANNGGGGSGGVIYLTGPMPPPSLNLVVRGGFTGGPVGAGGCASSPTNDGEPGKLYHNAPMPTDLCVDVDKDLHRSKLCGGMDCDDSNANVLPGGKEVCNGLDDDCSGMTDDGNVCSPGEYCEQLATGGAKCSPITDGGGAKDAGANPDHTEFGGGCGVTPATSEQVPWWLAGALPALSVLGLALRSSRRRRRRDHQANS